MSLYTLVKVKYPNANSKKLYSAEVIGYSLSKQNLVTYHVRYFDGNKTEHVKNQLRIEVLPVATHASKKQRVETLDGLGIERREHLDQSSNLLGSHVSGLFGDAGKFDGIINSVYLDNDQLWVFIEYFDGDSEEISWPSERVDIIRRGSMNIDSTNVTGSATSNAVASVDTVVASATANNISPSMIPKILTTESYIGVLQDNGEKEDISPSKEILAFDENGHSSIIRYKDGTLHNDQLQHSAFLESEGEQTQLTYNSVLRYLQTKVDLSVEEFEKYGRHRYHFGSIVDMFSSLMRSGKNVTKTLNWNSYGKVKAILRQYCADKRIPQRKRNPYTLHASHMTYILNCAPQGSSSFVELRTAASFAFAGVRSESMSNIRISSLINGKLIDPDSTLYEFCIQTNFVKNNGIETEVPKQLVGYLKPATNRMEILSQVDPVYALSAALFERFGYRLDEILGNSKLKDELKDEVIFTMKPSGIASGLRKLCLRAGFPEEYDFIFHSSLRRAVASSSILHENNGTTSSHVGKIMLGHNHFATSLQDYRGNDGLASALFHNSVGSDMTHLTELPVNRVSTVPASGSTPMGELLHQIRDKDANHRLLKLVEEKRRVIVHLEVI